MGCVGILSRDGQLPTKEGKANIDGNPLYFAQATSDGIPRTDGSGNYRDREVGNYAAPIREILLDKQLTASEQIKKIAELSEFEYEGKKWKKVETETIVGKKKIKEFTFETAENTFGKPESLSFKEVDGLDPVTGKKIKTVEITQIQSKGTLKQVITKFDSRFNEKSSQDHYGNPPKFSENHKYYQDRAVSILAERGIKPIRNEQGEISYHDADKRIMIIEGNGYIHIDALTQTQRGLSYQGAIDENNKNKPLVYDRPYTNDNVWDDSICQSVGPGVVFESKGYRMTQAEVDENGRLRVLIARRTTEAGMLLPGNPKPSGMTYTQRSDLAWRPLGFDQKDEISNWSGRPAEPVLKDYGSVELFQAAHDNWKNNSLPEHKRRASVDKIIPWIKEQIKAGEKVIVGGQFTGSGHVITAVGFNDNGIIYQDSYGNAVGGYNNQDGRFVQYPDGKFHIKSAYTIQKSEFGKMSESQRKSYLKDILENKPEKEKELSDLESKLRKFKDKSQASAITIKKEIEAKKREIEEIRERWKLKKD